MIDPHNACLLGALLGNVQSILSALQEKINSLKIMGDRHTSLPKMLSFSFVIPSLSPSSNICSDFLSNNQECYDETLRSIVSSITNNVHFSEDDHAWMQVTLPVRLGGMDIRRAVQLTPSAFPASAAASADLVHTILPANLQSLPTPSMA